MPEPKVKYKNVDKWVHGEVKEIQLIGRVGLALESSSLSDRTNYV